MNDVGSASGLVNVATRKVTLSFDNGPEPDITASVLDMLRARSVPATFFVIGRKLAAPGARPRPDHTSTLTHARTHTRTRRPSSR